MKLIRASVSTVMFIVLLIAVYAVHVRFFPVNVVFYAAILDALLAVAVATVLLFWLRYFRALSGFERLLLAVIWLLGGYAFAISVPTVIDRSLSFYILEKLQQRGGGIQLDKFEDVFIKEYMPEYRLVDIRLTEQLQSGTIEIKDGCVRLTPRGENIASIGRYLRQNWLPKQRLLMDEYTDVLADPFKDRTTDMDYLCD